MVINKVEISGEIAWRNGELKQTKSGGSLGKATLLHKHDGVESKSFVELVGFGRNANTVGSLRQGDTVVIKGSLKQNSWPEDKENPSGPWKNGLPTIVVQEARVESSDIPDVPVPAGFPEATPADDDIPF